jgi:cysteine desulfurase/selenocysteine lyase
VNVQALGCDFYVFSGHKLYGPTGPGVLYGRRALLEAMPPWQSGGEMILSVRFEHAVYSPPPYKFEAGTPNIAGVIGLGAAISWLEDQGIERVAAHERQLLARARARLQTIPGVRLIGAEQPADASAPIVSFTLEGVHPHDLGTVLDHEGVAVRAGHHCTQPLLERLGLVATARASFAAYNTLEELDRLITGVTRARELFL